LYLKYQEKGLEILAFPCNQFGGQEPGSNEEIVDFVKKYNVTFPVFDKIDVNGDDSHPLFEFLKKSVPTNFYVFKTERIYWNFTKVNSF
jgi:glutathione peroxidase